MSFTVRLNPLNRIWRGEERIDLATAAADCDIVLDMPCGGMTCCGKCRVRVSSGAPAPQPREVSTLGDAAVRDGWRLGCTLELQGNAVVEVPNALKTSPLKSFGPDTVLGEDYRPAFVTDRPHAYGFAVDVGTTTLAVALIDLHTSRVVATMSQINPQASFGADVMTRIGYARLNPVGNLELHVRLVAGINIMLHEILGSAAISANDVHTVAFVGNATMMHTLLGVDVATLGEAPFEGRLQGPWRGIPEDIGVDLPAHVQLYCAPVVKSHVGGDTVANVVATRLDQTDAPRLLIDLGTNTELVLATPERIVFTSASGGPAFEGGALFHGMRAIPGAIDRLRITPSGRVQAHTVARARPIGICGSGVLDAVAEMLRTGLLDWSGRMRTSDELDSSLQGALARRIFATHAHGRALWVGGPVDDPIFVTAEDVRQLQLVKASIAAATELLLQHADTRIGDIAELYVAGAFGNYIRKHSAQTIGLLPDIDPERVSFVGHTAGIGARLLLLDETARVRAENIAARADFVDLAGREDYEQRFISALPFPAPVEAVA